MENTIEKIKELNSRIELAIKECNRLIDAYGNNYNINDIDISWIIEILNGREGNLEEYTPSSTYGDYGPSNPWDAPGMSVRDFI